MTTQSPTNTEIAKHLSKAAARKKASNERATKSIEDLKGHPFVVITSSHDGEDKCIGNCKKVLDSVDLKSGKYFASFKNNSYGLFKKGALFPITDSGETTGAGWLKDHLSARPELIGSLCKKCAFDTARKIGDCSKYLYEVLVLVFGFEKNSFVDCLGKKSVVGVISVAGQTSFNLLLAQLKMEDSQISSYIDISNEKSAAFISHLSVGHDRDSATSILEGGESPELVLITILAMSLVQFSKEHSQPKGGYIITSAFTGQPLKFTPQGDSLDGVVFETPEAMDVFVKQHWDSPVVTQQASL